MKKQHLYNCDNNYSPKLVRKMAKDVGTAFHKSVVPYLFFFNFFEIPSLHVSSFFKCFFVTLDYAMQLNSVIHDPKCMMCSGQQNTITTENQAKFWESPSAAL